MIINDKQERTVIHLEINGEHHYFGNLKALTDNFNKEQLGATYNTLKNYNIGKNTFQNDKCIIRKGIIITSAKASTKD